VHGSGINNVNNFNAIALFERALGAVTGAPYVVMTDCCTHALELCLRYEKVKRCRFTAFTYLSVPMSMHKLNISYGLTADNEWVGEYQILGTRIWDSARLLRTGMYRVGQMQCLSFGYSKPLDIGRGGAILLDDEVAYNKLIQQRSDGRDLRISPWQDQKVFEVGYHYRPTIEEAELALEKLPSVDQEPKYIKYPDLREIIIK
jgi:dTDP-4-amino-4,6-dideoxygalactose transaminase